MTPQQEYELGQAMLMHEKGIDRGYMHHNSDLRWTNEGLKPFPRRRGNSLAITRAISELPYGHEFVLAPLLKKFRHSTVHLTVKKLLEAGGLTKTSEPTAVRGKPNTYIVSIPNRQVIEEVLSRE
tara:strand:- start:401 stop:775 length:375 start_codon:yes stop_codon:yes gene_type:complete